MTVNIADISDKPIELEEVIDAKIWDLDSDEIKFIGDIFLKGIFRKAGREILADIEVKVTRQVSCCRCLDNVELSDIYKFMLSYDSAEYRETLDIDADVREEILLNWPMKPLCSEECKGLDPHTGEKL